MPVLLPPDVREHNLIVLMITFGVWFVGATMTMFGIKLLRHFNVAGIFDEYEDSTPIMWWGAVFPLTWVIMVCCILYITFAHIDKWMNWSIRKLFGPKKG
jgi:heme/copper-type cytochrome/quinol oxidase subunit 2